MVMELLLDFLQAIQEASSLPPGDLSKDLKATTIYGPGNGEVPTMAKRKTKLCISANIYFSLFIY